VSSTTASGWNAPEIATWLRDAVDTASNLVFDQPARSIGEGGTIPFMAMLGERFPDAQFMVTGVLGPGTNAHGPNEFVDVAVARAVTIAVAHVLAAHANRSVG
jgi:acetylornithine deacetylase/succinyl-diaminopimelate desuccinylase-like protein